MLTALPSLSPDMVHNLFPPSEMRDLALAHVKLGDAEEDTLTETYARFEELFDQASSELSSWLGVADVPFDEIRTFWRDILYAAAWRRDGAILVLAVEHHDLGEPITLTLRCFSPDDVAVVSDERSAHRTAVRI